MVSWGKYCESATAHGRSHGCSPLKAGKTLLGFGDLSDAEAPVDLDRRIHRRPLHDEAPAWLDDVRTTDRIEIGGGGRDDLFMRRGSESRGVRPLNVVDRHRLLKECRITPVAFIPILWRADDRARRNQRCAADVIDDDGRGATDRNRFDHQQQATRECGRERIETELGRDGARAAEDGAEVVAAEVRELRRPPQIDDRREGLAVSFEPTLPAIPDGCAERDTELAAPQRIVNVCHQPTSGTTLAQNITSVVATFPVSKSARSISS